MDADGDGVITRAEWRETAQAFDQYDRNHDGVLSGNEVWVREPGPVARASQYDEDSLLAIFRAGYRAGFRIGYRQGFGPRH